MDRRETLSRIYKSTIQKISAFSGSWTKFLKFASQFYPYNFENIVLLYGQNPKAKMLATESQWLSAGRFVKENEKGIFAFRDSPESVQGAYLFDIAQTYGDPLQNRWSLDGAMGQKYLEYINRYRVKPTGSPEHHLKSVLNQNIQTYGPLGQQQFKRALSNRHVPPEQVEILGEKYILLLKRSAQYMMGVRCGFSQHQIPARASFSKIMDFHSTFSVTRLGRISVDMARAVLIMAENSVKHIDQKEKFWYETDLYETGQFTISQYSNIQRSEGRQAIGAAGPENIQTAETGMPERISGLSRGRDLDEQNAPGRENGFGPVLGDSGDAHKEARASERTGSQSGTAERDSHAGGTDRSTGSAGQPEIKPVRRAKEPPIGGSFFEP